MAPPSPEQVRNANIDINLSGRELHHISLLSPAPQSLGSNAQHIFGQALMSGQHKGLFLSELWPADNDILKFFELESVYVVPFAPLASTLIQCMRLSRTEALRLVTKSKIFGELWAGLRHCICWQVLIVIFFFSRCGITTQAGEAESVLSSNGARLGRGEAHFGAVPMSDMKSLILLTRDARMRS